MDGMPKSKFWRRWLFAICASICPIHLESLHATEHKQVLIIQSAGREFRPWSEYAKEIRAQLDRQSPWPLDVREHALETASSGNLNPELPFVEYLNVLYGDHAPDLIAAIGAPAAEFVQRRRDQLFPTTPAVFAPIEQRRLKSTGLTLNDAVVPVTSTSAFCSRAFYKYRRTPRP